MAVKIDASKVQAGLDRLKKRYSDANATKVEIGVHDSEIATYATYVEFGWVQRVTEKQQWFFRGKRLSHPPKAGNSLVNPPRPFLRGTLVAEADNWKAILRGGLRKTQSPARALELVGMKAAEDVRQTIINGKTSQMKFADRSSLTMEMYTPDASKTRKGKNRSAMNTSTRKQPLVLSGALLNSIDFQVK